MTDGLAVSEPQRSRWREATADHALRALAGAKVLERGQAYASAGAVQALGHEIEAGSLRVRAVVAGTHDYQVELTLAPDGELDADCDCPHAADGYFCKHQVALALSVHTLLGGAAVAPDAQARKKVQAAAKRAQTQAANRAALRQFVGQQGAAVLAERLWGWAERDHQLMAELRSWAAAERAAGDAGQLKPAITGILAARGFLDWRESGAYAMRGRAVLPLLQGAVARDAAQARALCEHALRRLFKVAEHADDSDGAVGELMHEVMAVLGQAVAQAPPPAAWVRDWFALLDDDPWGLWRADLLLEVAGPAFAQAYGRRVTDDWRAYVARQPAGTPAPDRRGAWDFERSKLRGRYIGHLRRSADAAAVIEAMRAHLAEAHEVVELVEYCESVGRYREAMQAAQQGARHFGDDHRIEACLLRCYERDGWDEEALALRRQAFERQPWDVKAYDALLAAAQAAGRECVAYRAELHAWAAQAERSGRFGTGSPGPQRTRSAARAEPGVDVSLRVTWLLHEGRDDEALALVQPPNRCSGERLWELARRLPAAQDAQAVALMLRVFDLAMQRASTPYARELELVRDITARQPPEARRAWLTQLRAQYKAKRNFVKGLPA